MTDSSRRQRFARLAGPAAGWSSVAVLIGLALWWQLSVKPDLSELRRNLEAGRSVIALAQLQRYYYSRHQVYADGWEPLAAVSKDPKAVRQVLKSTVDMDTLLVKGGNRFRIEANALGRDRKLIRFRSPHPAP